MIIKRFIASTALVASLATAAFTAAPAPALADSTATAITAGIAGLLVGALLFDHSSNRYYYVRGGHRYYVSNDQAAQYYQRRDPQYYNAHRSDFNRDHGRFADQWNHDHGHR